MPSLSIVIPCYNEADNAEKVTSSLGPIVAKLAERGPVEVLFIDDGSTDETNRVFGAVSDHFRTLGADTRVIPHGRNKGLGAAIRTGFAAARGDIIVTTDSDATYRFEEIPALLQCMTDQVDIVTASPYHPDGAVAGVAPHRLILSRGSSWIYRVLATPRIYCWTALFRAYRRRVIETIPFKSDGFLAGTEILVNAVLSGYRATEYPTTLYSRTRGESKAKLVRTIKAHLRFQAQVLAARAHLIAAPWSKGAEAGAERWGTVPVRSDAALGEVGRPQG